MEEFWAVDYANDSAVYDSGRNYGCASFFPPFESEESVPRTDFNFREGLVVQTSRRYETQFYFCKNSIWTFSSETHPVSCSFFFF